MLKQNFAHTKSITLPLGMQRNILILVVFFSFLGVVLAQQKTIKVQVIIDDEQEEHPGSVYITNSRTLQTKFTDTYGNAEMAVAEGDVLEFSSEFYETRNFTVSPILFQKGELTIHLNPKIIVLEQAEISDFRLTGDLAKDAKNAKFVDKATIVYHNLGIQEKDVPKPSPFGRSIHKGLSVDKVIGAINGYNKTQKTNKLFERKQNEMNWVQSNWKENYFTDSLKIPQNKIPEFIFFVYESSDIYEKIKKNQFVEAENILTEYSIIYLDRLNSKLNVE